MKTVTNRKIKDYPKNRIVHQVACENLRNLARIMVVLNRLYPKQFYGKRLNEWLATYEENCREMDKLDAADAYDYKMAQLCYEYGIDEHWCLKYTARNAPKGMNDQNIIVLANNVKLALVQTCMEYHIGEKRLKEICAALDEPQPHDPEKFLEKFGIEIVYQKVEDMDFRKLLPKKERAASYQDIKRGYEGLAAFKAYTDEVIKK